MDALMVVPFVVGQPLHLYATWPMVAQNNYEGEALEQTAVQSRIRISTVVQVPSGRWTIGESP